MGGGGGEADDDSDDDDDDEDEGAAQGGNFFSKEEVAKHNSAKDCWVILGDQVLNVTNFLKDHPGGELAIVTFAGKDATEEFDMIHPPDVIGKYAPDAIIGKVGEAPAAGAAVSAGAGKKKKGVYKKYEDNKKKRLEGEGK